MSASAQFTEFVLENLEVIGPVHKTRFFGGVGFSFGSVQFAMLMDNTVYFVVDDKTREKYEHAGMRAFSYLTKNGRIQVRRYFELPEDVLTDRSELKRWAAEAIEVASNSKPIKRASRKGIASEVKTSR
jgi:DNA transformation protein and related proteins